MPIDDISTNHGQIKRRGFNSAVDFFCDQAHGQTIGGNLYLSLATRAFLSFGKNPTEHGNNGYVYFEIHNKLDEDHIVDGKSLKYQKLFAVLIISRRKMQRVLEGIVEGGWTVLWRWQQRYQRRYMASGK